MRRREPSKSRLIAGAAIASCIAAALAYAAYRSHYDVGASLNAIKPTLKNAVKGVEIPHPVEAVDFDRILADIKRITKKGRKASKKLYKGIKKHQFKS